MEAEEKAVEQALPGMEKPRAKAKVFINPSDLVEVKVDVFFDPSSGEFLSAMVPELITNKETLKAVIGVDEYVFKFSKPMYDKLNKYRAACMELEPSTKTRMVNSLKLRDYLILFHLKEWNLKNDQGEAIPLSFTKSGGLTDESLNVVYSLHPSIMDIVMTSFESKMVLV